MFIRKKLNQSGSTSIQILRKEKRRTKLVETIACVKTSKDVQRCVEQAQQRLLELNPQQSFDLFRTEKDQTILDFFEQSREFLVLGDPMTKSGKFPRRRKYIAQNRKPPPPVFEIGVNAAIERDR